MKKKKKLIAETKQKLNKKKKKLVVAFKAVSGAQLMQDYRTCMYYHKVDIYLDF